MNSQAMHYEQALQHARFQRELLNQRTYRPEGIMVPTSRRQEIESQAFWTSLVMFIALAGPFLIARVAGFGGDWVLWVGGIWGASILVQGLKLASGHIAELK